MTSRLSFATVGQFWTLSDEQCRLTYGGVSDVGLLRNLNIRYKFISQFNVLYIDIIIIFYFTCCEKLEKNILVCVCVCVYVCMYCMYV